MTGSRTASLRLAAALACVLLTLPASARAQERVPDSPLMQRPPLHVTAARRAGASGYGGGAGDTVWVGHKAGYSGNYWEVGTGPALGGVNSDGMWTFDSPVKGDSLQGWWPCRKEQFNASGPVRTDVNRPWWALDFGNVANYVIPEGRFDASRLGTPWPGNRTFGVVGVWHSDPGNRAAGTGVNWAPLGGMRSAWMGMRRHGDLTAMDPVTGNPFNIDLLQFTGLSGNSNSSKQFPGYGQQMDQMLYRDLDLTGAPADSGLRITFKFRTEMSTGKNTTASTRTGWFEGDPISLAPGNFVSAEAGNPANTLAPVDSFQVYVGAPVESTWTGSDGAVRPIYDPLRRWFNEVLNVNARQWLFGRAGADSGTVTLVLSSAQKNALVAAAGSPVVRLVFRVHTNAGTSDQSSIYVYTSNGRGAAEVDDVSYDDGLGPVAIGDFEGTDPARDIDNLKPASAAWRSTGKPPATWPHVHDLASLNWADLCGAPGAPQVACDMRGQVVSFGDHDNDEDTGTAPGTADSEPNVMLISPTICLKSSPGVKNSWDLTQEEATATSNYVIAFDIYTGVLDVFTYGNWWLIGAQSYPAKQADGTLLWGDPAQYFYPYFEPVQHCFRFISALSNPNYPAIVSVNSPNPPDSVRIWIERQQQCYRFGITTTQFSQGMYIDNVSFGIAHGAPAPVTVNAWDWLQDTFPFNGNDALPGTAAFDTTSALVRTGLNNAQTTTTLFRFDVPGDSILIASPDSSRVDLVFRVKPGPGNYVVPGVLSSGLRRVPTSTTPVTRDDGSWWGTWEVMPGDYASPEAVVLHAAWPGGWNPNVWMSAHCDTASFNLFPVTARGVPYGVGPTLLMGCYHEDDPHFSVLGIARHKCFMIDTAGAVNSTNITCSTVPPWVTATLPRSGYDGNPMTLQGTSIFPDGLFTPGTHVEYFVRRTDLATGAVTLLPDTTSLYQTMEGSLDTHRWQQFSVLPDRWKDAAYGGAGMASFLVVDWEDRYGDEPAWRAAMDSLVCSSPPASRPGAGTGWTAPGGSDPYLYYATFVPAHLGQPGGWWDEYDVKAGDNTVTAAGTLGSRLSYHDTSPANLVNGKYSMQGPSVAMLAAYYRGIVLLTGDLGNGSPGYPTVFGPFTDRSANDGAILSGWLAGSTLGAPRLLHVMGDGFATSEPVGPGTLLADTLGVVARADDYTGLSGNATSYPDLTLTPALAPGGLTVAVDNDCTYAGYYDYSGEPSLHDVLAPSATVPEATAGSLYPPFGAGAPYIAGIYKPATAARPWIALTDGFSVRSLEGRFGANSVGRAQYFAALAANLYSQVAPISVPADCPLAVPPGSPRFTDFARLANNPVERADAIVQFGLAAPDHVVLRLYDVSGRLVRTLADQRFEAGPHALQWDGRDGAGNVLAKGVYFARLRYASRGFERVDKVVVLR